MFHDKKQLNQLKLWLGFATNNVQMCSSLANPLGNYEVQIAKKKL